MTNLRRAMTLQQSVKDLRKWLFSSAKCRAWMRTDLRYELAAGLDKIDSELFQLIEGIRYADGED